MKKLLSILVIVALVLSLAAMSTSALAAEEVLERPEGYPAKSTITWIVPSSAGGSLDGYTRFLADAVDLGGNIVVENISGGGYTIGMTQAAANDPDGTTLCSSATTGLVSSPLTMEGLAYDKDTFRLINKIAPDGFAVVTTRADNEMTSDDFWALLESGEDITVGTSSIGGHVYVELAYIMMDLGNLEHIKWVTYDGSNTILQAIQNGEIDYGLVDDTYIASRHAAGEVKGLLALSPDRNPLVPDVACVGDYKDIAGLGSLAGVKLLAIRADTPDEIVEYIKQQVNEVILSDEYQQYLADTMSGTLDRVWTEEELKAWQDEAYEAWDAVLLAAGLK